MIYRMAKKTDDQELLKLRIAYLIEDHGVFPKEKQEIIEEQLPGYYKEHLNEDLFVYVAEDNGELVATVYLLVQCMPANLSFPTGKIGDVLSVYTKKGYRRQGISMHLVKWMMQDAAKMELSYVKLEATKDGYPLYKKCGFEDDVDPYKPMILQIGGGV